MTTGKEGTVKFQGSKVSSYSLDAGSDGTIVKNDGNGEFIVRWSTPGVKQLTKTASTMMT